MSRRGSFDPEMVQRIRWLADHGESDRTLADALDCSRQMIYQIRTRRGYRHVPGPPWSADWLLEEATEVDEPVFTAERDRRWSARMARRRARWLTLATAGGLP